eukprot:TRINITY_DN7740_c0_g1_i2.p1 TRINITY_DN7740_c0_g1~~TRINITY_DN7740_c0_g1_i2.p1  ORF type:complete len:537 (+),score=71.80 TRINITY_DN7740_c0_g1_i2:232-1611(+)
MSLAGNWLHVGAVNCANTINKDVCADYNVTDFPTIKLLQVDQPAKAIAADSCESVLFGVASMLSETLPAATKQDAEGSRIVVAGKQPENNLLALSLGSLLLSLDSNLALTQLVTSDPLTASLQHNSKVTEITCKLSTSWECVQHLRDQLYGAFGKESLLRVAASEQNPKRLLHAPVAVSGCHAQTDILSALSYMLNHEVPSHGVLSGKSLVIFRDFLREVADGVELGPVQPKLQGFMSWLFLQEKADISQLDHGLNNQPIQWQHCRGSLPHLRGYPCGLWLLFHTMTVNAQSFSDGVTKLKVIRDYVQTFFGCRECASHFANMAQRLHSETLNIDQGRMTGALWLWLAHNKVNQRLKGSKTEDSLHIKQAWPSDADCKGCLAVDNQKGLAHYLQVCYGNAQTGDEPALDHKTASELQQNATRNQLRGDLIFMLAFMCAVGYGIYAVVGKQPAKAWSKLH